MPFIDANAMRTIQQRRFRLGAAADGGSGQGGIAPAGYNAPTAATGLAGDQALARLGVIYRELHEQADRIQATFGLAAIPCDVMFQHNAAVRAYLDLAKDTFAQITARGGSVVQTPYTRAGKALSPIRGDVPLLPPVFASPRCPDNAPTTNGALGNPALVAIARYVILSAVAAGTVVFAVHEVVVNWPNDKVQTVQAQKLWVEARLGCVAKAQAGGMSAVEANALCAGVMPEAPKHDTGFVGIAVAALVILGVVGGVVLWKRRGGSAEGDDVEYIPPRRGRRAVEA